MARINLLPWRAERRKQRQKEFGIMLALSALGAVLLSAVAYAYNIILMRRQAQVADPYEVAFFQSLIVIDVLGMPCDDADEGRTLFHLLQRF